MRLLHVLVYLSLSGTPLEQVKESAGRDISDAEVVRRIFDTAQRVDELEQELRDERARHEQELAESCNEYESRITSLEQDGERLQNEKQTLIADRQEKQALVEYVERERSLSERKAQAGIVIQSG